MLSIIEKQYIEGAGNCREPFGRVQPVAGNREILEAHTVNVRVIRLRFPASAIGDNLRRNQYPALAMQAAKASRKSPPQRVMLS